MFYSNEEFNWQVQQLIDSEGYSFPEACGIVQQRMAQDEQEYNEWVVEQFAQTQREMA
jgi:hypothetical protein